MPFNPAEHLAQPIKDLEVSIHGKYAALEQVICLGLYCIDTSLFIRLWLGN